MIVYTWDPRCITKAEKLHQLGYKFDKLIFFGAHEIDYLYVGERNADGTVRSDGMSILIDIAKQHKIKLDIITGSTKETPLQLKPELMKECNIHYYEYFWLSRTYLDILMYDQKNTINNILHDNISSDFLYKFICLNVKPRPHRCLIMDLLAKNKLIGSNAITWHQKGYVADTIPISINYDFKYWKPKILTLSEDPTQFYYQVPPPEHKHSFCQLVPETCNEVPALTEKTSVALFYMKPFLIAGCKYHHKILQRMGFELYDEIFDYSFDAIDDLEKRYEGLVQNFYRINFLSFSELGKIHKKLYDKLLFNKHHAIKLSTTLSDQPPIVSKIYKETKNKLGYLETDFNRVFLNYV